MGADDLAAALGALRPRHDTRLLVGHGTFDDAAVFEFSPGVALIQTVDFFAPIVDDPFDFGRVAAANALSDVYAMGGEPLTALAIVAFPTGQLPASVLGDILRGGEAIVHEAGALIVGGHTITDEEVKFGLAVTGRANTDRLLTNAGAKPGDILLLTKRIGTGILATQAKRGRLDAASHSGLVGSMTALNRDASRAALAAGATCATDVTGFGLLGHALHIARASDVTLRIEAGAVPVLDGVAGALSDGARTGGAERNERFVDASVEWNGASPAQRAVLLDPQTSGGLLLSMSRAAADEFQKRFSGALVIGSVVGRGTHPLVIA
jgi:selenide,water dikinase